MKEKLRNIVIIVVILCFFQFTGCGQKTLKLADGYPVWLKTEALRTEQTSGLSFIGERNGVSEFLMVDDVGALYMLEISGKNNIDIKPFSFEDSIHKELDKLPKKDFEAIAYDRSTGEVYLSIEGNRPNPREFTRIYRLHFKDGDLHTLVVERIERLEIKPKEQFKKFLAPNVAFEGIAVGEKYIYLGLEGFRNGILFADSTKILIVNKKTLTIENIIDTKKFNVHTICGLSIGKENELWGIDRNDRKIFKMRLMGTEAVSVELFPLEPAVPGYTHLKYTMALESIALDDNGNIYLTDDPWKTFFVPTSDVTNQMDSVTVANFKAFVPILYKYTL